MKRKQKSHKSGNFYHLPPFTHFDTLHTLAYILHTIKAKMHTLEVICIPLFLNDK